MSDDLQQMMERIVGCDCNSPHCIRCEKRPAVLEALRQAKNKGAREMREACDEIALEYDDTRHLRYDLEHLPLPHPDQERTYERNE